MSTLNNLLDSQEQICYVQCGFCSTILLVSVPCNSLSMVVTVRCGHCSSILSVNMMKACFVPLHLFSSINQKEEMVQPKEEVLSGQVDADQKKTAKTVHFPSLIFSSDEEDEDDSIQINQVIHKPPEKKQRAPSAYNHFIKEEIKRLKTEYPNMTHKQAFSTAAKNWAHCPQSQNNEGGAVQYGYGDQDSKMPIYSDIDHEVCDFGNEFHENSKALRESVCAKTPFLLKDQ